MVQLNLPAFEYKVTKIGEKPYIFDIIRRKYVVITPEEWVRQHVLHWLMGEHRFPKALIRTESGLTYHQLAKRTDILIYDREGVPFYWWNAKPRTSRSTTWFLNRRFAIIPF